MSATCASPISWDSLVDYWADDLDVAETDRIDEHLMGCEICTATSARVAAVREAIRMAIPALISRAEVEVLRARGLRIVENPVVAEQRVPAVFSASIDILLHRLGGLDLQRAERTQVVVTNEDTGEVLINDPRAPFDRESGEVLIACQRHFGAYSRTIIFEVRVQEPSGAEQVARYFVPHVFEIG